MVWEDKKIEETGMNPLKNMAEMQGKFLYDYARPSLTADVVLMSKEYREGTFKELIRGVGFLERVYAGTSVLLIKRVNEPFKDMWALPGGFMDMNETLEQCALRELEEETGIKIEENYLEELGTFDKVDRDPRGRVISQVFYSTCADKEAHVLRAGDDAKEVKWFNIKELPELAFDHKEIIEMVLEV